MRDGLKESIKNANSAFKDKAKFRIEPSGSLVMANLCPPHVLHPFDFNGVSVTEIRLGKSEILEVNELIK